MRLTRAPAVSPTVPALHAPAPSSLACTRGQDSLEVWPDDFLLRGTLCLQGEAAGPHFLRWACSLQSAGGGRQAGACPVYTFFSGPFPTSPPGFAA